MSLHRSTTKIQGESQGLVLYLNKLLLDNQKPTVPLNQGGWSWLGFTTYCAPCVIKKVIVSENSFMPFINKLFLDNQKLTVPLDQGGLVVFRIHYLMRPLRYQESIVSENSFMLFRGC